MKALITIEPDAERPELCGSCEHWDENDNAEPFCAVFRRTLALVPGNLLKRADACLSVTAAHSRLAAVVEAAENYIDTEQTDDLIALGVALDAYRSASATGRDRSSSRLVNSARAT